MSDLNKIKLFLVEDDSFSLEVMKDRFTDNPRLEVSDFETAEDCIANLEEQPAIIVLDYYLDKVNKDAMNGKEGLKLILEKLPTAKVIMLTGQDTLEIAEDLMLNGAYYYITKDENALNILEKKINYIISFI